MQVKVLARMGRSLDATLEIRVVALETDELRVVALEATLESALAKRHCHPMILTGLRTQIGDRSKLCYMLPLI